MRRPITLLAVAAVLMSAAPAARAQAAERRLVLEPAEGTLLSIEAERPRSKTCPARKPDPLRAKYRGRLEILIGSDGKVGAINTLPFESYLAGLAEVPASWPDAALRAQAIAARSYAVDSLGRSTSDERALGYDICATDRCQVYRGATVELGAFGERWVRAVRDTAGKVLTYGGDVIQAFYFSTSTGRTRRSFPGGSPKPWLPSVPGEDGDAPLANWTASVRLADLAAILRAAGAWGAGAITSVTSTSGGVRLSGGGRSTTLTRDGLRNTLNARASCLFPGRYPAPKMPQTVPSTTYTAARSGEAIVFRGRGWGHDVGMSQWGARSLAERGRNEAQILSYYYGPAEIEARERLGTIRVLAFEGMDRVVVSGDGPFTARLSDGGALAAGARWEVRAGRPLQVRRATRGAFAPVLQVSAQAPPAPDVERGATVTIPFTLSAAARVHAQVLRDGVVVARTEEQSFLAGDHETSVPLTGEDAAALKPGGYTIALEAWDGLDRVRTDPVAIVVAAPPPPPAPARASRTWLLALAAALLGVAAVALGRRRRGRHLAR